jgi:hypothetical protein
MSGVVGEPTVRCEQEGHSRSCGFCLTRTNFWYFAKTFGGTVSSMNAGASVNPHFPLVLYGHVIAETRPAAISVSRYVAMHSR